MRFENATGCGLASCIVETSVVFENCSDADGDGDWDAGESIYVSTTNMVGYVCADFYGRRRRTHPCQGAIERHTESVESSCGRVTARVIDGRRFEYSYDGAGRLVSYTDVSTPANSATYVYDYLGNRVKMRIGQGTSSDTSYYFVYEGLDPVAEYVDEGSDGSMDRTRIYWVLPDIDRRVGFVELEGGNAHYYFYLTDQVGSVLQIVDENDTVVNQYDYDAFGNLVPENSFETVENRYRFQGREWDAHAGHYYFRNRTYIPEWGVWPQPDPDIRVKDPNGCWGYVAFENDPLKYMDPLGLKTVVIIIYYHGEDIELSPRIKAEVKRIFRAWAQQHVARDTKTMQYKHEIVLSWRETSLTREDAKEGYKLGFHENDDTLYVQLYVHDKYRGPGVGHSENYISELDWVDIKDQAKKLKRDFYRSFGTVMAHEVGLHSIGGKRRHFHEKGFVDAKAGKVGKGKDLGQFSDECGKLMAERLGVDE